MNRDSDTDPHVLRLIKNIQYSKKISFQGHLSLTHCYITDKDILYYVAAEISNPECQAINFNCNQIGDQGVQIIVEQLKKKQEIWDIELSHNQIGDPGAQDLAQVLKDRYISQLDLSYNKIGLAGIHALAEAVSKHPHLTHLDLKHFNVDDSKVCRAGAILIAQALKTNNKLTILHLDDNFLEDEDAYVFADVLKINTSLKILSLFSEKFSDSGYSALLAGLEKNQRLKYFYLFRESVWHPLSEQRKKLKDKMEILLERNRAHNATLQLIEELKSDKPYYTDYLSPHKLGDANIALLADFLREQKNQTIKGLIFNNQQIIAAGGRALGHLLECNQTILELNLSNNSFNHYGWSWLMEGLTKNYGVQILKLENCVRDLRGTSDLPGSDIAKMLKENVTLQELYLKNNYLDQYGGRYIAQALELNSSLRILCLESCYIQNEGAEALSHALPKNRTLIELNLQTNNLTNTGVIVLAKALEKNKTLQKLSLGSNRIKVAGVIALAQALERNQTLQKLGLEDNAITTPGVKALAAMLKKNRSLTELNLSWSKIDNEGGQALAEVMQVNKHLKHLFLYGHNIQIAATKVLVDLFKKNNTLYQISWYQAPHPSWGENDPKQIAIQKTLTKVGIRNQVLAELQSELSSYFPFVLIQLIATYYNKYVSSHRTVAKKNKIKGAITVTLLPPPIATPSKKTKIEKRKFSHVQDINFCNITLTIKK